ncbi:MAG: HAD family hydrolase, partial [Deltaproteobacteria bacterium]|nr:HAD family hydrolase [Deltaproteobacteria bacterium]
MQPETELVMFDLDGTLIDSTWIYYEIVRVVMERLELPPVSEAEIRQANRNGTFLWEKLFPTTAFGSRPELKDEAWGIAREIAPKMFERRVKLLDGAAVTIKRLVKSGRRTAIVTSTPAANLPAKLKPLAQALILDDFAEIITADDTAKQNPAPDPLLECCRRLGSDPRRAVYVGDTRIDIRAGKAA